MARTAIATDSNSGITQSQAKELGVFVLPMPFFMRGKIQFEDIDLTQEQFYEILAEDAAVSTSQPSPGDLMDFWNKILEEYDDIVYIPMSSGLSASCDTATVLSEDYEGKVQVVNNQRISVTQQQSVLDAKKMANRGVAAKDIKAILEEDALDASIYIMVDTLKYLKKGGRVTPAAAMIGTVLNIKPVLTIQGEKLDAFEKARGVKQALIRDKRYEQLYLLPSAQTRDKTSVTPEQMKKLCDELKQSFDFVLLDCPAGIEQGFANAVAGANKAIVVTTPEVSAIRDADRIIGLLEAQDLRDISLVINRIRPDMVKRGEMMSVDDVQEILAVPLLGILPDDEQVVIATNQGEAIAGSGSKAGEAFTNISHRILGESVPYLDLDSKKGFFRRVFGR